MGYSTKQISVRRAILKLARISLTSGYETDSASTADLFDRTVEEKEIATAQESDHGHIILNLKDGRFVDYLIH